MEKYTSRKLENSDQVLLKQTRMVMILGSLSRNNLWDMDYLLCEYLRPVIIISMNVLKDSFSILQYRNCGEIFW